MRFLPVRKEWDPGEGGPSLHSAAKLVERESFLGHVDLVFVFADRFCLSGEEGRFI